ncbi:hypothetical protein L9F63_021509, partial [Diploptera punctata]
MRGPHSVLSAGCTESWFLRRLLRLPLNPFLTFLSCFQICIRNFSITHSFFKIQFQLMDLNNYFFNKRFSSICPFRRTSYLKIQLILNLIYMMT